MSLAAQLANIQPMRPGGTCSFVSLYTRLNNADAQWLRDILDDPEVTSSTIAGVLRAEGHDIAPVTVHRHRRKECRCESR